MTKEEFNLKYQDYIEEGGEGLVIESPKVIDYLDKQFKTLIKKEGFKFENIKEESYGVRVRTNLPSNKEFALEHNIEQLLSE